MSITYIAERKQTIKIINLKTFWKNRYLEIYKQKKKKLLHLHSCFSYLTKQNKLEDKTLLNDYTKY